MAARSSSITHSGGLEQKFRRRGDIIRYSWTLFLIAERKLWVAHSVTVRFKSDDQIKTGEILCASRSIEL